MRQVVRISAGVALLAGFIGCGTNESGLPRAVTLSPDGSRHAEQRFSPNGKRVAYWSPSTDSMPGYRLWVANADLSAPVKQPVTTITTSVPPLWSPDGRQLAVGSSDYGSAHVAIVSLADGRVQRVTQGSGIEFPLSWYRGGEGLNYFGTDAQGNLKSYSYHVKTGVSSPLAPGETRSVFGSRSPDGRHVAYFVIDKGKTTIWVADSVGGNPRQLTTEGFEFLEQYQEWSPDSRELLYQSQRTGRTDLWIIPIDGGKPRQLTRDVRNDFAGAWSPDGKWIAFLSDRGRQRDIWIAPVGGGTELRVTDDALDERGPMQWIPGTRTLTYSIVTQQGGVWSMDLATGKEQRLTSDSSRIDWFNVSPDGKQVIYTVQRGGGVDDLRIMPVAGGEARTLFAGGTGTVGSALWSPDGSKILFLSDRTGTTHPWVVDVAGGAARQIVSGQSYENSVAWSGDGHDILYMSNLDSRLGDMWKVPASGGQPTRLTTNAGSGKIYTRTGVSSVLFGGISPRGGQFAIMRLEPDGSVKAVWDKTTVFGGSLSPSGDSVTALVEQADGKSRSMILSRMGLGGRVVLGPGEEVGNWSNDGKWLLYTLNAGGATDLGMLNVADGTTRRLTTTPENEQGAEFTPDGRTVVFRRVKTVQRIHTVDLSGLTSSAASSTP
jgi:Tol biopolymer transport system component